MDDAVSIKDAAKAVGVGRNVVRDLVERGIVRAWKVGGTSRRPLLRVRVNEILAAVRNGVPQREPWRGAPRRTITEPEIRDLENAVCRGDVEFLRRNFRKLTSCYRWAQDELFRRMGSSDLCRHSLSPDLASQAVAYRPFVHIGPCVYFLFHGRKLVYIGQTCDLHTRLAQHFQNGRGKRFDSVFYISVDRARLCDAERDLIRTYRPVHNLTLRGEVRDAAN